MVKKREKQMTTYNCKYSFFHIREFSGSLKKSFQRHVFLKNINMIEEKCIMWHDLRNDLD